MFDWVFDPVTGKRLYDTQTKDLTPKQMEKLRNTLLWRQEKGNAAPRVGKWELTVSYLVYDCSKLK